MPSSDPPPRAATGWAVDMACGMAAGAAYTVTSHPFDTVKVAMQSRPPAARGTPAPGTLATAREIARGPRGALSLFRGLSAPLVGYSLECGVNYSAYVSARRWLETHAPWRAAAASAAPPAARPVPPPWARTAEIALSGALGGLLLSLIVSPTDLLKCRVQEGLDAGPLDAARRVHRAEGLRGFARGFRFTAAREVPGNAIFFLVYEEAQRNFPRWVRIPEKNDGDPRERPGARLSAAAAEASRSTPAASPPPPSSRDFWAQEALAAVACGGVAGSAFWLAMLPVDVAKTRFQIASRGDADDRPLRALVRETYRAGGARALYAGAGPVLLRAFPTNAVQFLAWECASALAGAERR